MAFDLPAYLARIGLAHAPAPDAAGLAAVQRAQRLAIPFENLDVPLGRGIALEPHAIFDKLVTRARGGYCFEQNGLFGQALAAIGFAARPLLARVWLGAAGVTGRTHTLLLVTIDGEDWIADAGFGGAYAPPMRLDEGETAGPDGARHRLLRDPDHGWMLARAGDPALTDGRGASGADGWLDQYAFTLEAVHPADLAMSNHWTSSAPGTRFTTLRIVSLPTARGFLALTDRAFTARGEAREDRMVADAGEYGALLAERFGIRLRGDEVAALGLF